MPCFSGEPKTQQDTSETINLRPDLVMCCASQRQKRSRQQLSGSSAVVSVQLMATANCKKNNNCYSLMCTCWALKKINCELQPQRNLQAVQDITAHQIYFKTNLDLCKVRSRDLISCIKSGKKTLTIKENILREIVLKSRNALCVKMFTALIVDRNHTRFKLTHLEIVPRSPNWFFSRREARTASAMPTTSGSWKKKHSSSTPNHKESQISPVSDNDLQVGFSVE